MAVNKTIVFVALALLLVGLLPFAVYAEEASATPTPSVEASVAPSVEPSVEATATPSVEASVAASVPPDGKGKNLGQVKQQVREQVQEQLKAARGLVRAKWFKWRFAFANAAGIAVSGDASEYHSFSLHGRVIRFIPIETIQSLKANASNANSSNASAANAICRTSECVDAYGVEKALGVMRLGGVRGANAAEYWFVGTWSNSTLVSDVFTAPYSFACLSGGNCSSEKIGSFTAVVREDYEGFKHLVVGSVSFTSGAYAGKSFNVFAWGNAGARSIKVSVEAQETDA